MNVNYLEAANEVEILDYPTGRNQTCTARYYVHTDKRGRQRIERVTIRNGRSSKPKKLTYGQRATILTGDDGKTYPAEWAEYGDMISVYKSNMMHRHETIHASSNPERFGEVAALFESVKGE